jgi:hypothetical protein
MELIFCLYLPIQLFHEIPDKVDWIRGDHPFLTKEKVMEIMDIYFYDYHIPIISEINLL